MSEHAHRTHLPQGLAGPLALRDFRRLLGSNAMWWQALFMENVVVGWLALEMTDSPWAVAVAGFCRSLPLLLFGYFAGAVADRLGRRRVIVAAQTANLICYATLLALVVTGRVQFWHLAAVSFGLGAAWALDWPARRSLLPDLVGKERTLDSLLLENFVQGSARILGPSLAGVLLARFGAVGGFAAMAALSLATLLVLRTLTGQPIPRTNRTPAVSPWSVLGQSLRYVGRSQPILGVMLVTVVLNLLLIPYMTLLPVFARDVLHRGPVGLGLLGAASGIGSFIGLALINYARRWYTNGWILTVGTLGMALALMVFSRSNVYSLSWATLLLVGIGQACFGIMQSSIILLTASDEMRSRTMGILVLAIGSDPFGKLQTGYLAQSYGAPTAIGLQAGVAALMLAAIAVALPGLRARQAAPVRAAASD
jgi:MFS family permease